MIEEFHLGINISSPIQYSMSIMQHNCEIKTRIDTPCLYNRQMELVLPKLNHSCWEFSYNKVQYCTNVLGPLSDPSVFCILHILKYFHNFIFFLPFFPNSCGFNRGNTRWNAMRRFSSQSTDKIIAFGFGSKCTHPLQRTSAPDPGPTELSCGRAVDLPR